MVQAEEHEAAQASVAGADSFMLDEEDEQMQTAPQMGTLVFDTIDTRHLSSLPLIRARLEKLLRNSPHQMHAAQNLLVKIVSTFWMPHLVYIKCLPGLPSSY